MKGMKASLLEQPQQLSDINSYDYDDGAGEDSPAYSALKRRGLLTLKYRVNSVKELQLRPSNTSAERQTCVRALSFLALPCLGPCFHGCFVKNMEVPAGNVRLIEDGRGHFEFCGQGLHQIISPYVRVHKQNLSLGEGVIQNGDRAIITVNQGFIGFAMDQGQPILLPPGMHQWQSETLRFERMIDLNEHVISLGPLTLITVDEGYQAITQDNGRQKILPGGETHLLSHRNWKFEKFIDQKIQTNNLEQLEVVSADNVLMVVQATVAWRIDDVPKAAVAAVKTMHLDGSEVRKGEDIVKLRNDVLKQAEASLSSFIGTVNFSSTFSVQSAVQGAAPSAAAASPRSAPSKPLEVEPVSMFDAVRLQTAVEHANDMTGNYGVRIISINIISAKPSDAKLMNSLAQGAVAAAEALQAETAAMGQSKAMTIEAEGFARAQVIRAKGEAEAAELKAAGQKKAADLLASSDLAVSLAKIEKTGEALGESSTFFFGEEPQAIGGIFANPNFAGGKRKGK